MLTFFWNMCGGRRRLIVQVHLPFEGTSGVEHTLILRNLGPYCNKSLRDELPVAGRITIRKLRARRFLLLRLRRLKFDIYLCAWLLEFVFFLRRFAAVG